MAGSQVKAGTVSEVDVPTGGVVWFTWARSTWLGRKTSTRRGRIGTSTPVLGLRPMRRPFWRTEKVPKPLILTDSPASSAALMRASTTSSRSADSFRDRPTWV